MDPTHENSCPRRAEPRRIPAHQVSRAGLHPNRRNKPDRGGTLQMGPSSLKRGNRILRQTSHHRQSLPIVLASGLLNTQ